MNLLFFLQIIYLILPAAIANMMPVFIKNNLKTLAYPIDFNLKIKGKRIFGSHKTFRGLIFGIMGSIFVVFIQYLLQKNNIFLDLNLVNYNILNPIKFGFLIGFFVLVFDAISSFIKRRMNFKPGEAFFILDQINGGMGFAFLIYIYSRS